MTTETIELACFIRCEGGLEIDNADVVIAFVEHMDGFIEVKTATVQMRIGPDRLAEAVVDALKQRAKEARDEAVLTAAGV